MSILPSGFFVLRTPLLPFDEMIDWGRDLAAPEAAGGDPVHLEQAVAADRARLRERLREVIARPHVQEAIFVASPDLHGSLEAWLRDPDGERGRRIERALVRYFSRMSGRATPFGLFAGCTTGVLGGTTHLETLGREASLRHTRLDMDYLCALAEALSREPALGAELRFRPNPSLYRTAGGWRYVEARFEGGARVHHLVSLESTPWLESALERAAGGCQVRDLREAAAAAAGDVSPEEAAAYVDQLIAGQIVSSDLQPTVTGREPIHDLADALRGRVAGAEAAGLLDETRRALATLDAAGIGQSPEPYRAVAERLSGLPARATISRLFQVDLFKPGPEARLGNDAIAEIIRGVEILHRIAGRNLDPVFAGFRDAFAARYEGREVPLLEALDEEAGIGFHRSRAPGAEASPLLAGLPFPPAPAVPAAWEARDSRLLRLVDQAARTGARSIELEEADLRALEPADRPPLPDAFAVSATLCAASHEAFERGEFRVVMGLAAGPSGARLLGRFCHGDVELRRCVEAPLRSEEAFDPEAIYAEIVHLPEGRLGNVLCRPVLRDHEIPILGVSGAPPERQIPLDDLRLRVEGGRIVLFSARLRRRVIPRLTSAHNFTKRSLGVYRLLGSLQDQGVSSAMFWSWGPLDALDFLPRVTSGRLVLAPARWRLDRHDLAALGTHRGADLYRTVQKMRSVRGLPRHVVLADSDNTLPIDLDNVLCVESFVDLVKRRAGALLTEMLPGPEDLCARGPEGRFVHELAVPFVRTPEPGPRRGTDPRRATAAPLRSFAPGSEWLYAKLYTGAASADAVLTGTIAPMAAAAIGSGDVDRWFFLRYADPEWHLRVRLHGDPARIRSRVIPALHEALAPLLAGGRVWRVQLDTYEREVERYGGAEAVELSERIFHEDSEAVVAILEQLEGDEGADLRWRLALAGIDALLSDLGFGPPERRGIVARLREGLLQEHRAGRTLAIRMGEKFRSERRELERLLDRTSGPWLEDPLASLVAPLRGRSSRLSAPVAELKRLEQTGGLGVGRAELAGHLTHMHVNRLLRSAHRAQELVLYDFLERLYASAAARAGAGASRGSDPAGQTGGDRLSEPPGSLEAPLHDHHS